ncbi:hypothetical protein [Bacillus massiliglaciei]|uniref:hypothetical protein n=1 Tax=Bacillus massiliglaciei TaxID=1816693 RepID=UPI000DA60ACA|nr:hypothetical protein [Bacillus massiliglaciei]
MKIFWIFILLLIVLIAFAICLDLLMGFDLKTSINNVQTPFIEMQLGEISLIGLFFLFLFAGFVRTYLKNKKRKEN